MGTNHSEPPYSTMGQYRHIFYRFDTTWGPSTPSPHIIPWHNIGIFCFSNFIFRDPYSTMWLNMGKSFQIFSNLTHNIGYPYPESHIIPLLNIGILLQTWYYMGAPYPEPLFSSMAQYRHSISKLTLRGNPYRDPPPPSMSQYGHVYSPHSPLCAAYKRLSTWVIFSLRMWRKDTHPIPKRPGTVWPGLEHE